MTQKLEEDEGWLLLKISKGTGRSHVTLVPRSTAASDNTVRRLFKRGLISVEEQPSGFACSILQPGRNALAAWKKLEVEEASARIAARSKA